MVGALRSSTRDACFQTLVNDNGKKIDNGFQIFNSYRIGYHIKLFNDKFFFQPSICVSHRAYHTQLPDGFKQLDDKWSKFIFPEPGLNIHHNLYSLKFILFFFKKYLIVRMHSAILTF